MQNEQNPTEFTKEFLNKLRARLPYRYAIELQKIIKRKHKKEYTTQHIRRTLCNGAKITPNIIINEAIKLADKQDYTRRKAKMTLNEW